MKYICQIYFIFTFFVEVQTKCTTNVRLFLRSTYKVYLKYTSSILNFCKGWLERNPFRNSIAKKPFSNQHFCSGCSILISGGDSVCKLGENIRHNQHISSSSLSTDTACLLKWTTKLSSWCASIIAAGTFADIATFASLVAARLVLTGFISELSVVFSGFWSSVIVHLHFDYSSQVSMWSWN